jgi:signal transduction histidine kinase
MAVSLLAVVGIVITMFEREVVAPLHRIDVLLRRELPDAKPSGTRPDDLKGLEKSVTKLVEQGRRSADRNREMDAKEGLAQVGELAAEMAHEFKRPLASIQTAIQVLEQEYDLNTGGREVLVAVNGQLDKLYETMQDLFSLAKPVVLEEETVDVAETLDDALTELSAHPALEDVEVRRAYSHEGITVAGDQRRLRQAFLNILANGAEAMSEGGVLTLSVQHVRDSAKVTFTDTGPGLDPEAVDRALKPFYSTKPTGTGLGLPLVARIVAAHRGGLAIESRPGKGTTVQITLPLTHESVRQGE